MKTLSMGRLFLSVPALLLGTALLFAGSTRLFAADEPAPQGPVLVTMFQGNFTTKKAKVGDPITAKVKKTLKVGDLEIPSGSKLIGSVQTVQSAKAGDGNSSLTIQFQKVELKDHKELPVRGLIVGIGKVAIAGGLGYSGVLGREGAGSTPGLDPTLSAGHGAVDDVPNGSSLPGVALATHLDANQATEMRGIKCDIQFDSSVMMKVELFRTAAAK